MTASEPQAANLPASGRRLPVWLRVVGEIGAPLAVFLLLALALTWPLALRFSSAIAGSGDAFSHLWGLWHTQQALLGRDGLFFTHLVYYPVGITLFGHALGPLSGLFAFPFWPLGPEVAYNSTLLIGFALTGYAMYWLARDVGCSRGVAYFAGLLYMAAPLHMWAAHSHLTKVFLGAIPLTLLAVLRALRPRSRWYWPPLTALSLLIAYLQSPEQYIYAGFGCLFFVVAALWRVAPDERRAVLLRTGFIVLWAAMLTGPLLVATYLSTRGVAIGVDRNLESLQHQPDVLQLVLPYRHGLALVSSWLNPYLERFILAPHETSIFLSWTALALLAIAVWRGGARARLWVLLLLVCVVFALGPALRVAGRDRFTEYKLPFMLPYALLTGLPGLDFMRTPGRFMLLGYAALAVAAGLGLESIRAWLAGAGTRTGTALVVVLCTGLAVLELWPAPLPLSPLPPTPAFYRQLAADDGHYGILDLPIRPRQEANFYSWHLYYSSFYQLYQMVHGKGISTGYISRYYDRHPLFAQFISENMGADSPYQDDLLVDGRPTSRYANILYDLGRNNYRYVVVHKPQPDDPAFQPGDWGERAAATFVDEVFGGQAPRVDDEQVTVYDVPSMDDADQLVPNISLLEPADGQSWTEHRWGESPAPFLVHMPQPQLARLKVTVDSLWTPDHEDYFEYAVLTVTSGDGAVAATTPIGLHEAVVVPLALSPGSQTITLTVTPVDRPDAPLLFAIDRIDLVTNDVQPAADLEVAGAGLLADWGSGWHASEGGDGQSWRWASSPAEVWVYAPQVMTATLAGTPVALHVAESADGKGDTGVLRITGGNGAAIDMALRVGEPFAVPVTLLGGWNRVELALAAGNFRPVDVQPETGDARALSFALADMRLAAP